MNSNLGIAAGALILGIITFLYRYSFISTQGKKVAEKIPAAFLMLLGPATFSAIIANNLLATQQSNSLDFQLRLAVSIVSIVVAYLSRSILITLIFGLVLLYILQNFIFN